MNEDLSPIQSLDRNRDRDQILRIEALRAAAIVSGSVVRETGAKPDTENVEQYMLRLAERFETYLKG